MSKLIAKALSESVTPLYPAANHLATISETLNDLELFINENCKVADKSEVSVQEALAQIGKATSLLHSVDDAILNSKEWQNAILESINE